MLMLERLCACLLDPIVGLPHQSGSEQDAPMLLVDGAAGTRRDAPAGAVRRVRSRGVPRAC
jgi:hypothetical protein